MITLRKVFILLLLKDKTLTFSAGLCAFFPTALIIADGAKLTCHADIVDPQRVEWSRDLTCEFGREIAKKIIRSLTLRRKAE